MNRKRALRETRGAKWGALFTLLVLVVAGPAAAAEIVVGKTAGKPGESVTVPVHARGVENLAGVKLVFTYDADRLTFEQANKTPLTTSLMHIVNSKKAGRLIVVMAGARGVDAEDGTILDLRFKVPEDETDPGTAEIELQQVEVMSDKLKEVAATGVAGGVQLGENAAAAASTVPDETPPKPPEVQVAPAEAAEAPIEKPASVAEAASPPPAKADAPPADATETAPSPGDTENVEAESAEPPVE